jgi:hypothetical protein
LEILRTQQSRDLHEIVALNESWFYYFANHLFIWLSLDGTVRDRERITTQSERKMMPIIVWGPNVFSMAAVLESYYLNKVLMRLSEWPREHGGGTFRKLIIHADQAGSHKAMISQQFLTKNWMTITTHQPYSQDLDPPDFCLFGHLKILLRAESFETGETLLSAIQVILGILEKSTLSRVFLEWMTWLE